MINLDLWILIIVAWQLILTGIAFGILSRIIAKLNELTKK